MRDAEQVTFGGSGLDRAAELRADSDALARARADPAAGVLALWRGKPLLAGPEHDRLGWLSPDSAVLAAANEAAILLGRDAGAPRFAVDVSAWGPDELPATLGAAHDPSEQRLPALPADPAFAELRSVMTRLSPREAELAVTARALTGWHATHRFCARCGAETAPAMAGWQRDCPACGTHHFPRTDPVVIMLVTRGNRALLGRSPAWSETFFSLLAGFVEPGETLEAAVRREVAEETGVAVGAVGYLASQPWPFPASLMIACHGRATSHAIEVDADEIAEARWVSREDVLASLGGENPALTPARPGAVAHFVLRSWCADRLE